MNETSRDILNRILPLKNFIEKFCPACKVIVSYVVYRSDNGEAYLTVKNVNDHLDALNVDVVDNINISRNCLKNGGLHLNSTVYGKLVINFMIKKEGLWDVSHKITEFDKENARSKEKSSSQSAMSSELNNNQ